MVIDYKLFIKLNVRSWLRMHNPSHGIPQLISEVLALFIVIMRCAVFFHLCGLCVEKRFALIAERIPEHHARQPLLRLAYGAHPHPALGSRVVMTPKKTRVWWAFKTLVMPNRGIRC